MPNQLNFQSDTEVLSELYTRYLVSRVIANKQDNLLDMEVTAEFSEAILQNNVEIHIYSLFDNSLIFSGVIKNINSAVFTKTLKYSDNTFKTLLYIDFAKALPRLELPNGQYSVTLNFFRDEIGSYDNRVLKVENISTSRTEVQMELTSQVSQSLLNQFAIPRIPATYIEPVLKQIFNQSGSSQLIIPTSPAKIDSSSIYQNFSSGSGELLITYGFDEDDGSRIGINTIAQNVLNLAYPLALNTVRAMIEVSGSTSFTETELSEYVINAIDVAYDSALNDEVQNPQNYRFDLI